jgi:hypothetical protein
MAKFSLSLEPVCDVVSISYSSFVAFVGATANLGDVR